MTPSLYQAPLDQAWLQLWVGLYGADSKLARYLNGEAHNGIAPLVARPGALDDQARKPASRQSRPAAVPKKARSKVTRSPAERAARRLDRDAERVTRLPVSEWAKSIVGDERIAKITLDDILNGIEDYFEVFKQMRRYEPAAYAYFSRVGAPIVLDSVGAYWSNMETLNLGDPNLLPSFFGCFFTRIKDDYRDEVLNEKPMVFDFELFEKPKNYATVAPPGATVFTHYQYSLKRKVWTPAEERKMPWVKHPWNISWHIGVSPGGETRVLPSRWNSSQLLPSGHAVHHSAFKIPPGLADWSASVAKRNGHPDWGPHGLARRMFNMVVAFTASAAANGIQVTVRRGNNRARFGVPIANLKNFFADRDPEGARRSAILHFIAGHDRHMADGRIIEVGEHLRGNRAFSWRGYEIEVGVPGIHYPSPEGFAGELYKLGDPQAPLPAEFFDRLEEDPKDLVGLEKAGKIIRKEMSQLRPVSIRRGRPTVRYHGSTLPQPNITPEAARDDASD